MGRLLCKRSDVMGAAMKPHVHAAVIKAWADGAQVQCRTPGGTEWIDIVGPCVAWADNVKFRVKPAPVTLMYRVALMKNLLGFFTTTVDSMEEAAEIFGDSEFVKWAGEWEMVES